MSPMTMSLWMPCFLSSRSRSVLAKPLEHQCSCATISPGRGVNSERTSPPHVPYLKDFRDHDSFWIGAMYFQSLGGNDETAHRRREAPLAAQHSEPSTMRNATIRFCNGPNSVPYLPTLRNEIVVGVDDEKASDAFVEI